MFGDSRAITLFSLLLQVISQTRRCPPQGFYPGSRAFSAMPTTPASDIRPEESLQELSPTITILCKANQSTFKPTLSPTEAENK